MKPKAKISEKELLNACAILVVLKDGGEFFRSEIKRKTDLTSGQTDHLLIFLKKNLYVIPRTTPSGNRILIRYGISRRGMVFLQNTLLDSGLNQKIGFMLRGKELKNTLSFIKNHRCRLRTDPKTGTKKTGAIGGETSYRFTPTSLGTAVIILCACGKEKNVTDYDSW